MERIEDNRENKEFNYEREEEDLAKQTEPPETRQEAFLVRRNQQNTEGREKREEAIAPPCLL